MALEGYGLDRFEQLRRILEDEQGREVSYEEAQDFGCTPMSFYEALSSSTDDSEGSAGAAQ